MRVKLLWKVAFHMLQKSNKIIVTGKDSIMFENCLLNVYPQQERETHTASLSVDIEKTLDRAHKVYEYFNHLKQGC